MDFKEGKMVYSGLLFSLPGTAGQRERKWLSPSTCQITDLQIIPPRDKADNDSMFINEE